MCWLTHVDSDMASQYFYKWLCFFSQFNFKLDFKLYAFFFFLPYLAIITKVKNYFCIFLMIWIQSESTAKTKIIFLLDPVVLVSA